VHPNALNLLIKCSAKFDTIGFPVDMLIFFSFLYILNVIEIGKNLPQFCFNFPNALPAGCHFKIYKSTRCETAETHFLMKYFSSSFFRQKIARRKKFLTKKSVPNRLFEKIDFKNLPKPPHEPEIIINYAVEFLIIY